MEDPDNEITELTPNEAAYVKAAEDATSHRWVSLAVHAPITLEMVHKALSGIDPKPLAIAMRNHEYRSELMKTHTDWCLNWALHLTDHCDQAAGDIVEVIFPEDINGPKDEF